MGFERYYQVKILSKQLKFKINFSTLVKNSKLNPWFVTGFVDGDFFPFVLIFTCAFDAKQMFESNKNKNP